jgi:hypothetical protein
MNLERVTAFGSGYSLFPKIYDGVMLLACNYQCVLQSQSVVDVTSNKRIKNNNQERVMNAVECLVLVSTGISNLLTEDPTQSKPINQSSISPHPAGHSEL